MCRQLYHYCLNSIFETKFQIHNLIFECLYLDFSLLLRFLNWTSLRQRSRSCRIENDSLHLWCVPIFPCDMVHVGYASKSEDYPHRRVRIIPTDQHESSQHAKKNSREENFQEVSQHRQLSHRKLRFKDFLAILFSKLLLFKCGISLFILRRSNTCCITTNTRTRPCFSSPKTKII